MSEWELDAKIEKLLNDNIKEVPWEGKEVNNWGLKSGIKELILNTPFELILEIKERYKN